MKGSYQIVVSNANIRYDFTIKRNITIIKGDSATGKTTLVEMVREFYESGADSGIDLRCERPCRTLGGRDWKLLLTSIHETIVFIDEDNAFLPTVEFAEAIRNSDNYYVLVTREGLPNLPYSVEEIYGIRQSGKYAGLKPVFNEFYHIYGEAASHIMPIRPKQIIT
ncbi:MAG: Fis family transcriptional regulator [Lachnospiraceae bacterium]|nr:Fis family transcriptional regulator [Lachnospiraceae bacterium]